MTRVMGIELQMTGSVWREAVARVHAFLLAAREQNRFEIGKPFVDPRA